MRHEGLERTANLTLDVRAASVPLNKRGERLVPGWASGLGRQMDTDAVRCQIQLARGGNGEPSMSVILSDLLLFSCLAAFVTGIVIALANLFS